MEKADIRAFVAHGFTDDDADVVGRFLKFFTQLKDSLPHFSWEHAEPAEPKVLADKVLGLLANKNALIAICTKKERAVDPAALQSAGWLTPYLKGQETAFDWKTSDWIIQEIGLAKGRGLSLILLVERDVRPPGGLQGDVEYIPFDRAFPERAFGKILEMLQALSPSTHMAAKSESSSAPPPPESSIPPGSRDEDADWASPQPSWTQDDFEYALLRAVLDDNEGVLAAIEGAYTKSDLGKSEEAKTQWDANKEYCRVLFGKKGSLTKLVDYAAKYPKNSEVQFYLASGYDQYGQYRNAARSYELAAELSATPERKMGFLHSAAIAYSSDKDMRATTTAVDRMKIVVEGNPAQEIQLLRALQKIAETTKDDNTNVSVMERILDLNPDDNDARFSLAYKYAQLGNKELALLHYLKIPVRERSAVAWNNLGVAYDALAMSSKSVDSYRKAEEAGETLAMSNLAYKLMGAGFLSEAQELCDRALKANDYHKNVGLAAARVKELGPEEDEKRAATLEKARPINEFYVNFGKALAARELTDVGLDWVGPDCDLALSTEGQTFRLTGTYERRVYGGLRGALAIQSSSQDLATFRIEYRGTLHGRSLKGKIERSKVGDPIIVSTLLSSEDETTVLITLSGDGQEMSVMERLGESTLKFYAIKRKRH